MIATAFRLPALDRRRLGLAALAGLAWGGAVTGGLAALEATTCGGVCLAALPTTFAMAAAGGLATMGPLVLFGRV